MEIMEKSTMVLLLASGMNPGVAFKSERISLKTMADQGLQQSWVVFLLCTLSWIPVIPAPHQVRDRLRQESSPWRSAWIPACVGMTDQNADLYAPAGWTLTDRSPGIRGDIPRRGFTAKYTTNRHGKDQSA